MADDFRLAESKIETFRDSVLRITVQGKAIVEQLDLTKKSLAKVIESKESEMVLVEGKIKDCNVELQLKESELGLVKESFEVWSERLSMKKEELGLVESSIAECRVEHSRLERVITDCCEKIGLKEKEFGEIYISIGGYEEELDRKKNHVASLQALIGEYTEELKVKEKRFATLECKKKDLELIQTSFEELKLEHHKEEEKLESCQMMIRQREDDLEYLEDKLDSVSQRFKECNNDVELKEREFNEIHKSIEECSQELELKEKELKSVQESTEVCRKELHEKRIELISVGKYIVKCSEELETKKKHLYSIEKSAAELSDEWESNELDLHLFQTIRKTNIQQLKEKEKHFDSLKKDLEDQVKGVETKERHFEEYVKEFESFRKAVEERSKSLELKEKKLSNILHSQVKIEQPESSKGNEGARQFSFQSCSTKNGRNLQLLLNQYLQNHDLVFSEVSRTIAESHDPAMLVLDAMQGFYPHHTSEGETEFDVGTIRRSCSIMLEMLSDLRPEIDPLVRDEALKVAGEWRKIMRVTEESSFEVLGYLHLLDAYGLAAQFDRNELESLLNIVRQHRQAQKLCQNLGFGKEVDVNGALNALSTGLQCNMTAEERSSLPLRNKHDLSDNEILQLLQMVPDPAMLVLDFIQGSCAEHWKYQGGHFEEGSLHCYIRFLQKLKDVLPKMHQQVKPEAKKLAVGWKTKMVADTENSLEILVFLQLLGTFELVDFFKREEVLELLWTISHHKQAPDVCRALRFMDIVPNFVLALIGRRKYIEAVRFVCAFKLTDNFRLEAIFKDYWEEIGRTISGIYTEGPNPSDAMAKAIDIKANALSVLIECIEENKLESFISIDDLKKLMVQLEKEKAKRRHLAPSPSPMINMQSAARTKHNVGNSAPAVQPVPSSMTQTQHGRMQHGIGTFLREQTQVQKNYKRPRTEAPTTSAYIPDIPASVNQYRSPLAVQCSPGMAHSLGKHSLTI